MKYSKSQDTPQRAHSPSLFPALMLLPVAFQPHFILQPTDHPSSRALLCSAALPRADVSPTHWLCPSPWGGSLQTFIYLCSKATSQLPWSRQSHIVTELTNFYIQP